LRRSVLADFAGVPGEGTTVNDFAKRSGIFLRGRGQTHTSGAPASI